MAVTASSKIQLYACVYVCMCVKERKKERKKEKIVFNGTFYNQTGYYFIY